MTFDETTGVRHSAQPQCSSSTRLVVIAASAGGLTPIVQLLSSLPADFPAAVAVVQHRGADEPERLLGILEKATRMRVRHAADGDALQPGTVYVCPPQTHMTAEHCIRLVDGPKVRFVQPSADVMFESVARSYADRALAVVLSGNGTDAAVGSLAIAQAGGLVLAQDPTSSDFSGMPGSAVKVGAADQALSPEEIAQALRRWAESGASTTRFDATRPAAAARSIKVLLADDHRIVLDGLRILIEGESDMQVIALAEDGLQAVELALELAPDVVVMDIRMPQLSGVDATQRILASKPATRVIALSSESDPRSMNGIFTAGATGYLTKHRAFGELVQAIRAVMAGKTHVSPEVARLLADGSVTAPKPSAAL
jgi:two-component system, chemotaxis family, protein-glutamate methylesterase/glutaminase